MSGRRAPTRPAALTPPPPPLPEPRQDVVLTLPGRERYGARVARVSAQEIVLVLMLDARDRLRPGAIAAMALEYPAPRGLVRLEGHGAVATHDLVRFQLDGAVDVLQRRDYVRVQVVRPLALALVGSDDAAGAWIDTLTVNLSGNGLLAAGPDTLAIGDRVCFRVALVEGDAPLEGRGRVMRIADAGQRGIAIEELDRDARQRLIRFIFECERMTRQRTRDSEL